MQSGETAAALLFGALDRAGDNKISRLEFMELCTVLKVQWEEEEKDTWLQVNYPKLYRSSSFQRIRSIVLDAWFQTGANPLQGDSPDKSGYYGLIITATMI